MKQVKSKEERSLDRRRIARPFLLLSFFGGHTDGERKRKKVAEGPCRGEDCPLLNSLPITWSLAVGCLCDHLAHKRK